MRRRRRAWRCVRGWRRRFGSPPERLRVVDLDIADLRDGPARDSLSPLQPVTTAARPPTAAGRWPSDGRVRFATCRVDQRLGLLRIATSRHHGPRPADRYPNGPRLVTLAGACLRQDAGLGRAAAGSEVGPDSGRQRRPRRRPNGMGDHLKHGDCIAHNVR